MLIDLDKSPPNLPFGKPNRRWKDFSSLIFLSHCNIWNWMMCEVESSVQSGIWPPIWRCLNTSRWKYFFYLWLFSRPKPSVNIFHCLTRRTKARSRGQAVPAGGWGCGRGAGPGSPGHPRLLPRLGKHNLTISYQFLAIDFLPPLLCGWFAIAL